jgi:hypothetical protein
MGITIHRYNHLVSGARLAATSELRRDREKLCHAILPVYDVLSCRVLSTLTSFAEFGRSMHWNGAFASMLFLNNWEYTRNVSFAKQYTYPLVSGLVSWWSCFLQRSTSANGSMLLNDWNPIDPDESAENQPVHNPMTGLAFAKRLASFKITLSKALFPDQPAPPDALEIMQHLAPFPLAPDAPTPVWSSWRNHSSGCCTPLYPIFPTELLSQASDEATLEMARRSVKRYTGLTTTDLASRRPVEAFPAAVRAGHSTSSGWQAREVLEGLEKMLALLKCCDSQMLPVASGGGVENIGTTRAVNEMLLVAPDGLFIEVFPFFPVDEPASFTTLRSKGGWLVSASQSASGLVSGVQIEATVADTCRFVDPWASTNNSGSTDSSEPTVTCTPGPTAPSVTRTSVGRRHGLLTWRMDAGQRCNVTSSIETQSL